MNTLFIYFFFKQAFRNHKILSLGRLLGPGICFEEIDLCHSKRLEYIPLCSMMEESLVDTQEAHTYVLYVTFVIVKTANNPNVHQ